MRGTIASVAAAAGITDAGLLYHFPTKEDLLLAVLIHHDRLGADRLHLFDPVDEPCLEHIRALAQWGAWMEEAPNLQSLHITLSADSLQPGTSAHDYFTERYQRGLDLLSRLFERAKASGVLGEQTDPLYEASAYLGFLDGLRLQWHFAGGRISISGFADRYIQNLIDRLAIHKV